MMILSTVVALSSSTTLIHPGGLTRRCRDAAPGTPPALRTWRAWDRVRRGVQWRQSWRCSVASIQAAEDDGTGSNGGPFGASEVWSSLRAQALRRAVAMVIALVQATAPVPLGGMVETMRPPSAEAVLYSPDTKIPRSPEVALRRAIPAVNVAMKKMQESLEDIFYLLRIPQRKPYGTMEADVKKALKLATDEMQSILAAVPADQQSKGVELYNSLINGKNTSLTDLLQAISDKDADKVSIRLANALEIIADLETIQAPGLPFLLPAQYQQFPRLTGRATIQFNVAKADGSGFSVAAGGGLQKDGAIEVVLDGYSAPLTSGNIAALVDKGAYNGIKLRSTEQAVLTDNESDGSVGKSLPIEILPAGEFQPLYRTTLSVQDGELPVLPLSVYGAVAMAHNPTAEDFSSPAQFFFYLYDKRSAGLGGLSFDEGQFSVVGYVTKGKELLSQLKTGDVIISCKMLSGADRLVVPDSS